MSIAVMTAVWKHSKAKGTDLLVLLALADKANDEAECWPSMASIGKQSRLDPRNARQRIRSLEKLGEVVVIENGGRASTKGGLRSNRYRITVHLEDDPDTDARIPIEPEAIRMPASASVGHDTDSSIRQIRMPASARIRTPASAEPSVEPSGNRQSLAPASLTPAVHRSDPLFDALADVLGIDTAELTPPARGAMNKALADLRKVGAEPEEIRRRADNYRARYPKAAMTPTALAKHWPQLAAATPAARSQSMVAIDDALGRMQ